MNSIDNIRILIDRFYRGVSTPYENSMITDFFKTVNQADLPNDLVAERELFILLDDVTVNGESAPVPDDLMFNLVSFVDNNLAQANQNKKGVFGKFIFGKTARRIAAIFVLSFTVVATLLFIDNDIASDHRAYNNQQQQLIDTLKNVLTPHPENLAQNNTSNHDSVVVNNSYHGEPSASSVNSKSKTGVVRQRKAANPDNNDNLIAQTNTSDNEGNYIEITDPEQARLITQNIASLLNATENGTEKVLSEVSSSITTYRKISMSVQQ